MNYPEMLYKHLEECCLRVFVTNCPECNKEIFSVDEKIIFNSDEKKIVAKFICDCGKKFKSVAIDYNEENCKYKFKQVLVTRREIASKKKNIKYNERQYEYIIENDDRMYKVLPHEIKKIKKQEK